MNNNQQLNERSMQLLKTLVERYSSDGQPVGSKALAQNSELNLSSATIRNIMADLEELGLVHSPHTSAGRVPTVSGYRMFVNNLLTVNPIANADFERLQEGILHAGDHTDIVHSASRLLAELTQMAGVVTLPKRDLICLRHIEFLPLSHNRVLVIFVTHEQEVHNRIIHTDRLFSATQLQQATNYLNAVYSGHSLASIREAVVQELQDNRVDIERGMLDAIQMANLAFKHSEEDDYVLAGETNLMEFSELAERDRLKALFDAFNQKQGVLHLLDHSMKADGIQIFIGEESGYQVFEHCSVVTSPYSIDGNVVGVLGVIGPTRMAYQKVIPYVDVTAKLLTAALNTRS